MESHTSSQYKLNTANQVLLSLESINRDIYKYWSLKSTLDPWYLNENALNSSFFDMDKSKVKSNHSCMYLISYLHSSLCINTLGFDIANGEGFK